MRPLCKTLIGRSGSTRISTRIDADYEICVYPRSHPRLSASIIICVALIFVSSVYADEQTWSGSGDGTSWSDKNNWFPANEPTLSSDVRIDSENASVVCNKTFNAQSITIGGRETSQLTAQNFIYGTIAPSSTSDEAVSTRAGGTFKLQGAGVVTIRGSYKDSEGTPVSEPSFLFWIE